MIYRQFRNSRVARLSVTCTVFPPVGAPCFGIAQTIRPKKSRTLASAMKCSFLTSALVAAFLCGAMCSEAWSSQQGAAPPSEAITVAIPGPLRSFLRMAGISQKIAPDEVLPLLARNVFQRGYEGVHPGRQTEFLILLIRYVHQARELQALAGPEGVIHVSNCEEARPLLKVLGYLPRPDCGRTNASLLTDDAQRAFLTIDSGFPLPDLEERLREGKPFEYPFPSTQVPALLIENDWRQKGVTPYLVDALLEDPAFAHFYWALSRMDGETQVALRQPQYVKKMLPFATSLDFYGSHVRVRSGHVIVPGGLAAEAGWKDLVGVGPEFPTEFILRLLAKDGGWLAAYFDALSRVNQTQQTHFAEKHNLRRYYDALRGKSISPDAVTGVFRPNSGLLLLVTRARFEASGQPYVPGNLEVWKKILNNGAESKTVRRLSKRGQLDTPEQLLETMFALSRAPTSEGPLQTYLFLNELDAVRAPGHRLSPETTALMASKFADFCDQFRIFTEFPALDDASIGSFIASASSLNKISNNSLRGNALGTFQASVGLWQIFARQDQVPEAELNGSWRHLIKSFDRVASSAELFDAGRNAIRELLLAVTGNPHASQDEIINLLAGPRQLSSEGRQMHELLADRMRRVLDEQRLVSLDVLLRLGDALQDVARVKAEEDTLLPLAGQLREFEMPQPIFRASEREQWAAGIYNNSHTDIEMRTDLTKVIKGPTSPAQLATARGRLASFLRDTLVGLNYAYYEPPGAQILHHNPLFVRSHDFAGESLIGEWRVWQASQLLGVGSPAGGGAHLVGSLADLPYVLSEAEQHFITPENVQALTWDEVAPSLLTSAIVPRWWKVTRNELHAVALYQQTGEELLTAAAQNEDLRQKVMNILDDRMAPRTAERLEQALRANRLAERLPELLPADTFYLAAEYRRRFPEETDSFGPAGTELESLSHRYPEEVNWERLSRDFGVPHTILEQSYRCDLLNLEPIPAYAGYSSRLLAESWDSTNLYWVRLADEMGYSPVMLTRLIPQLTRRMVEKIFATDIEDWPALWRAARETGDEFRNGKMASLLNSGVTSPP